MNKDKKIQNEYGQFLITPYEYLETLPPSSVNNSREMFKSWLRKANADEGNYYTRKLLDMGFVADTRNGYDWGNEPAQDEDYNND